MDVSERIVPVGHPRLEISENLETQEVFIKHPNRREKIIVYKPNDGTSFFRIRYESGKGLGGALDGAFTRRSEAVEQVDLHLRQTKKSEQAKKMDLFGPEPEPSERPVLKRKKVIKKDASESTATDG